MEIRSNLTPILSDLGVDLVLNGHDHIYTRSDLMHGTVPASPGVTGTRGDRIDSELLPPGRILTSKGEGSAARKLGPVGEADRRRFSNRGCGCGVGGASVNPLFLAESAPRFSCGAVRRGGQCPQ
ncbi:MAG: hypothetical protein SPI77_00725 [Corynebacterium sp.]|nr:hypothetical protein [Corynebacterium sp.]